MRPVFKSHAHFSVRVISEKFMEVQFDFHVK